MATFKKKTISPAAVAVAEANAASAPIVGDPRVQTEAPAHAHAVSHDVTAKVGSSQDIVIGQILEVPVERVKSNPLNPRACRSITPANNRSATPSSWLEPTSVSPRRTEWTLLSPSGTRASEEVGSSQLPIPSPNSVCL